MPDSCPKALGKACTSSKDMYASHGPSVDPAKGTLPQRVTQGSEVTSAEVKPEEGIVSSQMEQESPKSRE